MILSIFESSRTLSTNCFKLKQNWLLLTYSFGILVLEGLGVDAGVTPGVLVGVAPDTLEVPSTIPDAAPSAKLCSTSSRKIVRVKHTLIL